MVNRTKIHRLVRLISILIVFAMITQECALGLQVPSFFRPESPRNMLLAEIKKYITANAEYRTSKDRLVIGYGDVAVDINFEKQVPVEGGVEVPCEIHRPDTHATHRVFVADDGHVRLRVEPARSETPAATPPAPIVHGAKATVTPAPDTLSADEERFLGRMCDDAKQKLILTYGRLDDDHILARYVRGLLDEMLGPDKDDYNVIILPEWQIINMLAMPDGTIIVSGGFLKAVEYRDEVEGVLAHEINHIRHGHTKLKREFIEERKHGFDPDDLFRFFGIQRIHEVESDIRWMIEDFKGKKPNPLGFKIFLNRMTVRSDKGWSISHGADIDRPLNQETAQQFLDIATLSHDLVSLPEDIREAAADLERNADGNVMVPFTTLMQRREEVSNEAEQIGETGIVG